MSRSERSSEHAEMREPIRFDREKLDALVAEGWLRAAQHPDADLWIYNYSAQTQYEKHWTPETLACRGLILDADGKVVARPFGKFFNFGDPAVGEIPVESYVVTEKIDGSLGIVYEMGGERFVASRGSFTSDQARIGTQMLREHDLERIPGVTPLFEIVYPENRIVVDYGGRRELTLLAAIDNASGLDTRWPSYSGPKVQCHDALDLETLQTLTRPNAEGFVVVFESGLRVKVKFEEYVRLHRIVTGVNARRIWASMRDGDDIELLLDGLPDEIHSWITGTREDIRAAYQQLEASCRRVFIARPEMDDRKTIAQYFLASGANSAVLFRMLDGKPFDDLIWKAIEPEPLVPDGLRIEEEALPLPLSRSEASSEHAKKRLVWARDLELLPARAWRSTDGRLSIIWDPEGYWLWKNAHEPMGIYKTLKAAKSRAGNV